MQYKSIFLVIFFLVISIPYTLHSQPNDFNGTVTYVLKYPKGYFNYIRGFDYKPDSLIIYAIKNDNLVAKEIDVFGIIAKCYVKIGAKAYIFHPQDSSKTDYSTLPDVFDYSFINKFKKKEKILGHPCTKLEYRLGSYTMIYFWVADDINLSNHGAFFNLISNQGKLVLKRQLIYNNKCISYEAVKIENTTSEKDFDL